MAVMAMRRARFEPAADPNVIPFIDVLLVLLIIFMVTAPKPTTDLRVDLPRPGPSRPASIPPTIVTIHAAAGGFQVMVGSEESTLDWLGQRTLAHILGADPVLTQEDALIDARVFVRADLDVAYQDVIAVVETLQDAQFQRVAIAAQNADAS
jgi:biopolymer transport protein ExbD